MIKIAINGFGRIGRNTLRALYENGYQDRFQVVAINDLVPIESNAHMLQYDTAHGRFNAKIEFDEDSISIEGQRVAAFSQRDPAQLPWKDLDVDIVFECTGFFKARDKARLHADIGAR